MDKEGLAFAGDIIGAQIGATHKVMNELSDMGWQTALEWAEKYRDLMRMVYATNDSVKLERKLDYMPTEPDDRTLDHYRTMGHVEERGSSGADS